MADCQLFSRVFKTFYKATKILSGVYYPTSSLVIKFILLITDKIAKSREDSILGHAVALMEEKFIKYFSSISHVYCFAIIFDPTKKLPGLQIGMEGIGECLDLDYSEAFAHVKEELFHVFHMYHDKFSSSVRSEASQQMQQGKTNLASHLWKKLKCKFSSSSSQSQTTPKWNSVSELNHYLKHDFANIDPDLSSGKIDLLEWWKNNKWIFPVLSHFARDVLLVPVSTVSLEATFSMAGRIIEERRSSLTPKMVEAITCAKDWELAKERQQHQLEDLEIVQAYADLERMNDLDIDE